MPARQRKPSVCHPGIFLLPVVLAACDLNTEPGTVFVDTSVRVEVLEGAGASDTIQARVPVRVVLIPEDEEAPRPISATVRFVVLEEGCGQPETDAVLSDRDDEAAGTWILGTETRECTMEIRAFAPSGTLLGLAEMKATIEAGAPVDGWLLPGEVARAVDTLALDPELVRVEDRFANAVPWRFLVLEGPAVVLSEEREDPRSRTLVATGEGSGTLDIDTSYGVLLQAGFDVCVSEGQRWIRVFRQEDASTVLAACP